MLHHGLDKVVAATSLFYHYSSSTIKDDSNLMKEVKQSAQRKNFLYVLQKYGITEDEYRNGSFLEVLRGAGLKEQKKKRGV